MERPGSGYGEVVDTSKTDKEFPVSIKCGEFIDSLNTS
jgi:hypothetical protein